MTCIYNLLLDFNKKATEKAANFSAFNYVMFFVFITVLAQGDNSNISQIFYGGSMGQRIKTMYLFCTQPFLADSKKNNILINTQYDVTANGELLVMSQIVADHLQNNTTESHGWGGRGFISDFV